MLNIIGIGLNDFKDLSLKAIELIKESDEIILEYYTSKLNYSSKDELKSEFKRLFDKDITIAYRNDIENKEQTILDKAKKKNISLLVIGDAVSATTHTTIICDAKSQNIKLNIVSNASVFNAIAITGLQLYKFGKTASLVFEKQEFDSNYLPESPYRLLQQNQSIRAHSLFLLDIKIEKDSERFMTPNQAMDILLKLDNKYKENYNNKSVFNEDTKIVVCSRLGSDNYKISYGLVKDLINSDFGNPLHCLIVPSSMHFVEEDVLNNYNIKNEKK